MSNEIRRKFIRHPTHIPITVGYVNESQHDKEYLNNVSLGGIAFQSDSCWKIGAFISISILVNPPLQLDGKVMWCRFNQDNFDVGVEIIAEVNSTNDITKKENQVKIYQQILVDMGTNMDDIIII
ncbi:MAG: PilZ domain-containing protein [Candidatus Marithrix sp.]|nr:PilZ domain-containing protein [Candidatus Marithrix sp.]